MQESSWFWADGGKRAMKNYRSKQQIVYDVLTIAKDANRSGIAVTELLTKANLSHSRLGNIITKLTASALINEIKFDGKRTFIITEKGSCLLEEYKKFHELASTFGLGL